MKKFCNWQIKCKEDNDETFTYTAHLHEGIAFQCPYKSFKDSQEQKYLCIDVRYEE